MFLVFLAQNNLANIRPFYADIGIVPQKPTFVLGMIEIITLVGKLCVVACHNETVRKALRDQKLFLIFLGEQNADPLPVCFTVFTQIDGNIKNLTLQNTH